MKKVYTFVVRRFVIEEYRIEIEAYKRPSKLEIVRALDQGSFGEPCKPNHVTVIKHSIINRCTRSC